LAPGSVSDTTLLLHICNALDLSVCAGCRALPFFFSSRRRHTRSVSAFLLNRSSDLTYTDIAGDPVLYGNLPPREISMKDVFRSGDSSKKFKIAEGQWYRYAPSYVSPAYHLLEGFPFIQEPPSGDLQERVLIRHH